MTRLLQSRNVAWVREHLRAADAVAVLKKLLHKQLGCKSDALKVPLNKMTLFGLVDTCRYISGISGSIAHGMRRLGGDEGFLYDLVSSPRSIDKPATIVGTGCMLQRAKTRPGR